MSFEDTQDIIDGIVDMFDGDRYATTAAIYNKANELMASVNNSIKGSEAIDWALTGKPPINLEGRVKQHMKLSEHRTSYMENLLGYVYDDDVVNQVRQSFDQSVYLGSLTFYYGNIREPSRKVRVRILTRMCWYDIKDR